MLVFFKNNVQFQQFVKTTLHVLSHCRKRARQIMTVPII